MKKVVKFGGSSLASAEQFQKVGNIIRAEESRKYVVPSGEIIGLRMFTKGVMIISTDSVATTYSKVNPSKKAGIKAGDLIVAIDDKEVKNAAELSSIISSSGGKVLEIEYSLLYRCQVTGN